jgi:hypothetical protein
MPLGNLQSAPQVLAVVRGRESRPEIERQEFEFDEVSVGAVDGALAKKPEDRGLSACAGHFGESHSHVLPRAHFWEDRYLLCAFKTLISLVSPLGLEPRTP